MASKAKKIRQSITKIPISTETISEIQRGSLELLEEKKENGEIENLPGQRKKEEVNDPLDFDKNITKEETVLKDPFLFIEENKTEEKEEKNVPLIGTIGKFTEDNLIKKIKQEMTNEHNEDDYISNCKVLDAKFSTKNNARLMERIKTGHKFSKKYIGSNMIKRPSAVILGRAKMFERAAVPDKIEETNEEEQIDTKKEFVLNDKDVMKVKEGGKTQAVKKNVDLSAFMKGAQKKK